MIRCSSKTYSITGRAHVVASQETLADISCEHEESVCFLFDQVLRAGWIDVILKQVTDPLGYLYPDMTPVCLHSPSALCPEEQQGAETGRP